MSEIYSIEPKTHGKVIICTNLGDLEILLFSNECPIACQNFIQHCLNNYYNKNKFFRIIPKFLIQTGDHTNTGLHNEYAFNEPFKNEYNSRLKFLYCGCLSFANLNINKPSNGSQFFITLDKAEYLNNKNTLFGKVAKHSIYNLLKFNNIKTNKYDEPIEDIPYIEYIKIIENPFHHLVPYTNYLNNSNSSNKNENNEQLKQNKKKELKFNLLSFDYEDDMDKDSENEKTVYMKEKNKGNINEIISSNNSVNVNNNKREHVDKMELNINSMGNKNKNCKTDINKDVKEITNDTKEKGENKLNENKEQKKVKSIIDKKKDDSKKDLINMLKKKTRTIEKSKHKKNKNSDFISDLGEKYFEDMNKYKKMSKKEKEELSLKKLEDFDNRLKRLFSNNGKGNCSMQHDWLNTNGLKFNVDSSNAYEHEEIKKNVQIPIENDKNTKYDSKFNIKEYIRKKN